MESTDQLATVISINHLIPTITHHRTRTTTASHSRLTKIGHSAPFSIAITFKKVAKI
jgi:hypothetical protein